MYKDTTEHLKSKSGHREWALRSAIQAMDVANALTTAAMANQPLNDIDEKEIQFQQEWSSDVVVKHLSDHDNRFTSQCPPDPKLSPSS
jgi:predicted anti-sigma-YlaC factor YlaD